MNNFKSCIPCVCTGSGCKRVCKRHDIGTQCGATAINTATKIVENIDATNIQQHQQNSQKLLRQLEIVFSSAEVYQNDPDDYQAAAFVPSKVPRWRKSSISEHFHPRTSRHPSHDQGECHGQAQHCA